MEMNQLRYFESAARTGSMMAAAAECHVSQPALSVQIRKLEEDAGRKLFERRPRGVFLTPAGERTLKAARLILGETSRWREDMRAGAFGDSPALRVVAQHFISSEILPAALAETLAKGRGRWHMRFHERSAARLEEEMRAGLADVAIFDRHAVRIEGFSCEPLLRMPYRLFCPEGHPLAKARSVTLAKCLEHNFLLYRNAPELENRMHRLVFEGSAREPQFSGEHPSAIFELVSAGVGVAVLPSGFEKRSMRRSVVPVRVSDYDEEAVIAASWPEGMTPSPSARHLFGVIRRQHKAHAAE